MLSKNIDSIINSLPKNVTLVAATKYVDSTTMRELYSHNIKDFGENRVQSFLTKYEELKDLKDIKWHFIGHLQRNKAKSILNKIDCLYSLDRKELTQIIEKEIETPLDTFIEVSINLEESKNGVPYYEIDEFVNKLLQYKKIHLVGLMMMATKGSMETEQQFSKLAKLRDELELKFNVKLPYLSMGMSDDYISAIKAGTTHVRLGRILYDL